MEAYRTELELIYKNKNLEEMYVTVAKKALNRCRKFNKRGDFKKLCEVIRGHQYQNVRASEKNSATNPTFALNIKQPETNDRLMELRFFQLGLTKEMGLWQDAYRIMEDINVLLKNRKKTSNDFLQKYYQHLYEVFWHSNHYLLHAVSLHSFFAVLRRKSEEKDQVKYVNHLVLAALSIPKDQIEEQNNSEFFKRNCHLISSAGQIMTREQLIANLKNGPYLDLCSAEVRAVFNLITDCKDILQFSSRSESVFTTLKQNIEFEKYLPLIEQNIIASLVEKLSTLYKSMSFATFKKVLGFLDFGKCEKYLLNSHGNGGIRAQIDYEKNMFIFTHDQIYGDRSASALVDFSNTISTVQKQIERARMTEKNEYSQLEKDCLTRAHNLIEEAEDQIKRSREETTTVTVKNQASQQREAMLRKKNREEEEKRQLQKQEKQYQEFDQKTMHVVMERVKNVIKMDKNATYKGKRLEAFSDIDFLGMSIDICMEIEQEIREKRARAEEEKTEKQFKNRDYLERLIRRKRLEALQAQRDKSLTDIASIRTEAEKAHSEKVANRDLVRGAAGFVKAYKEKVEKARLAKFQADVKEYRATLTAQFAKTIYDIAAKTKRIEEEKKLKEQEEKAKHDEIELENEKRKAEKNGTKPSAPMVNLARSGKTAAELQDQSTLAGAAASTGFGGFGAAKDDKKPALSNVVLMRGAERRKDDGQASTQAASITTGSAGKSDLLKAATESSTSTTITRPTGAVGNLVPTRGTGIKAETLPSNPAPFTRGTGIKAESLSSNPAQSALAQAATGPGKLISSRQLGTATNTGVSSQSPVKESDLKSALTGNEGSKAIGRGLLSTVGTPAGGLLGNKPQEPSKDKPEEKKIGRSIMKN